MTSMAFPYRFGVDGRTAESGGAARLRELVEMLLFTQAGERVMRPTLGTPISGLLFEGMNDALAAALQSSIHAALQQWLGDVLVIVGVDVSAEDTTLAVTVTYRDINDTQPRQIEFRRGRP